MAHRTEFSPVNKRHRQQRRKSAEEKPAKQLQVIGLAAQKHVQHLPFLLVAYYVINVRAALTTVIPYQQYANGAHADQRYPAQVKQLLFIRCTHSTLVWKHERYLFLPGFHLSFLFNDFRHNSPNVAGQAFLNSTNI